MKGFQIGFSAAVAMLALTAVGARVADAQPTLQRIHWSTFMRSGPGDTYPVIDELEHDTPVTVSGCAGRWCSITSGAIPGYVDRDALDLPAPPSGSAAAGGAEGCFVADQTGYRHPSPTQFCQTQPAVAPAH